MLSPTGSPSVRSMIGDQPPGIVHVLFPPELAVSSTILLPDWLAAFSAGVKLVGVTTNADRLCTMSPEDAADGVGDLTPTERANTSAVSSMVNGRFNGCPPCVSNASLCVDRGAPG